VSGDDSTRATVEDLDVNPDRDPIDTGPPRHPWLGWIINGALVALAFALLGWAVWQNRAKIRAVFSGPLDWRLLGIAFAIYMVGIVMTFGRWFMLVRVIEPRFRFRATIILGFIGMVYNLVVPGAVGGDLIKGGYLARMHIKKTQAIASMVIDRIVGLLALFVLASIAGALIWNEAPENVRKRIEFAWVAVAAGFLVLAAIFTQAFSRMFPRAAQGQSRFALIVAELKEMSATYRNRLDVVAACLGLSVVSHSLNVIAYYVVGKMLFPNMITTLAQHFLMAPLMFFSMAVPLPFGALGLTEEVGDQLFKLVGHPSGFLAMMGFRVLMYTGGLVGACVYLAQLKEVRELTGRGRRRG
jgi:glycosyltransferase 2 family protein